MSRPIEGDPRFYVDSRPDAVNVNVNNWNWNGDTSQQHQQMASSPQYQEMASPQQYQQMQHQVPPPQYPQQPPMPQIPQMPPISAAFMYDPIATAAMSGGQKLVDSSSGWIDTKLRPLFAVDDAYVLVKLSFLLFPFRRWQTRIAKPDLYIPIMSFVTYVLVAGYLLGIKNRFSPEKLGMISSSALFCVGLEVALMAILFSVFNAGASLLYYISFSGYKFVPTIWAMLISLLFKSTGYYLTIVYTTLSLGYYLVRSFHMETVDVGHEGNRKGVYLSGIFCLLQPLIMFWLSYEIV